MIAFNDTGVAMSCVAIVVGIGFESLIGSTSLEPALIVGGAFLAASDVADRLHLRRGRFGVPQHGGALCFLPAWAFGGAWCLLGFASLLQRVIRLRPVSLPW